MSPFGKKRRPVWELWLVGAVVAVVVWLSFGIYARSDRVRKQETMIWELRATRGFVTAAILERRRRPKSLEQLSASSPTLDPFGNPYHYNPKTGWVRSTTPGYSNW